MLNSQGVEYLIVGGYAVGFHGYPRATGDMDVWVAIHADNARRLAQTLQAFGFSSATISPELFLQEKQVIRMGTPPLRIELLTTISGVSFRECSARAATSVIDGVDVRFISLDDLKTNKKASGRLKDLSDLEHLP